MMAEEKYFDKTLKLPLFSGKVDDWPIWSEKFLIRAKRKGYKDILLGREQIPSYNAPDITEDERKVNRRLRELNETGFEELAMSIDTTQKEGRVAFDHLRLTKTSEYPEGNCKEAWERLKKKYLPNQAPIRLKLQRIQEGM